MMKKMMVLYNETSGSSESKEIAERFKKAAEARGEAVILQPSIQTLILKKCGKMPKKIKWVSWSLLVVTDHSSCRSKF